MGVIHNIQIGLLSVAVATLLVLAPAAAGADEAASATLDPIEANRDAPDAPALAPERGAFDATVPLTRAAARRRIETMSPTDWLASYGDVVVGRTGAPNER
ncbi:MAG: hypothetical protein NXI30_12185 [bacterium]|nr:hypothetical protein [bacterium]